VFLNQKAASTAVCNIHVFPQQSLGLHVEFVLGVSRSNSALNTLLP